MATRVKHSGRTWPPPPEPWVLRMCWEDLLFAHWQVDASVLRARLPPGLTLDLYRGEAWLGVVPFVMSNTGPRGLPSLPRFPELNVRTYVTCDGKPGVWFFSLDAASALTVFGARTLLNLPYLNAKMRSTRDGEGIEYECRRSDDRAPQARFVARYGPTGPVATSSPGTLEYWFTERYRLYGSTRRGTLYACDIDHERWPLQPARAELRENTMAAPVGVTLSSEPLLHFSRRQDVIAWRPRRAVGQLNG
jgi:uncharacterized protein